jgi:DNA-binding NarL/FixJ family response regulator
VTRVVLVDDHPLFIQALRAAVERAGIDVVATASRGDELMDLMRTVETDAVLLDLAMPGLDGYECLAQLRELYPKVRVIVVSASDDEENIRRALDSGAVCFVGKATDPNDLAGAVHVLLSDSIHLEVSRAGRPGPAAAAQNGDAAGLLTPRELEILRLASDGLSNSEMAKQLWVTDQTVKFHLSNIYRKLDVSNRTGASRWAREHGLLDDRAPSPRTPR